jgi:peptide/nickel transport system substrate-binding protein
VGSNVAAEPLDDVRVRQAIAYALDKDRVVAEVLRGSGYTASLPWPKYSFAFDEQANATYTRDVAKAKQLVSEVGSIPELPLTYQPTPIQEALAAIVQANLGEVGIPVKLDPVDGAQFVKQLIGAQFKGLWIATHSWAQYTPSTLTVSAYPFNAHKNASRFESDDYIAAADAAWEIPDGASKEAVAAYGKVSDQLLDNVFLAEIAIYWEQWATSAKLQGAGYTKRSELLLTDAWLTSTT